MRRVSGRRRTVWRCARSCLACSSQAFITYLGCFTRDLRWLCNADVGLVAIGFDLGLLAVLSALGLGRAPGCVTRGVSVAVARCLIRGLRRIRCRNVRVFRCLCGKSAGRRVSWASAVFGLGFRSFLSLIGCSVW